MAWVLGYSQSGLPSMSEPAPSALTHVTDRSWSGVGGGGVPLGK